MMIIGTKNPSPYKYNQNMINEIRKGLKDNNIEIKDELISELIEDYLAIYIADDITCTPISELPEEFARCIKRSCGISENVDIIREIVHKSFRRELEKQLKDSKKEIRESFNRNYLKANKPDINSGIFPLIEKYKKGEK